MGKHIHDHMANGSEGERLAGVIYGTTGSTEFTFAVSDPTLRRLDYVAVRHQEGHVLAQVMGIERRSGISFEDAQAISDGKEIESHAKASAFARVIGYKDERGLLQSPRTPFDAGIKVEWAPDALIRNILGLEKSHESGAYLGLLKGHNLPVYLHVNTMVQKHVSVLAKTGAGKSYTVGVLIEELLKKNVPLVIIDPHGEYASFTNPNIDEREIESMLKFKVKPKGYGSQITQYSPDTASNPEALHLTLDGSNMEAREILDLLQAKLTGAQAGLLYQAVKEVRDYRDFYTLRDIIDAVNRSKSNAKWNVVASLEALDSTGLFSEKGTPARELVKKGMCTLINLRGVPPDIQDVVVARIASELFEARKVGKVPPHMMVIEEAHNFCPERGVGNAVSLQIIRTIASEGRKFGMGLTVVSQRPAKVDKNVISQCNTQIILKVTNPNDLKAITSSVEGLTSQSEEEIQRLPIGVAMVAGGGLSMPILVEVRTRETRHGGVSVSVTDDTYRSGQARAVKRREADEGDDMDEPARAAAGQASATSHSTDIAHGTSGATRRSTGIARGTSGASREEEPLVFRALSNKENASGTADSTPRHAARHEAAAVSKRPTVGGDRSATRAAFHTAPPQSPSPQSPPQAAVRAASPTASKVESRATPAAASKAVSQHGMREQPSQKSRADDAEGMDTAHIHRVANRLGYVVTDGPKKSVRLLTDAARNMDGVSPRDYLMAFEKLGRQVCHNDEPDCASCPMNDRCRYYGEVYEKRARKGLFGKLFNKD
ncbi:MAG: hypothetical protein CVT48_04160 [Thermoplasmata archaeon HGW-Thermoplasmata-1]|nr:MAG: hypothetical protein CVT48_04160 [Thermoplasmata archaeon HGW-Thermoplasmata-1]